MPKIVIRHLSGTKANQVEEVPLQGFHEILIGREANAQIRFDADREDLVSRNHARIVRDPVDPTGFLITDLESRNGTFINRQRIYGATRLQHGDRVQMGPSGPEFTFEVDPPPAMRPTRLAESVPPPPTREAPLGARGTAVPPGMADTRGGPDAPRPVGRATVERLVGDVATQMKGESRKTMWTAVIGILLLLVAVAGVFVWNRHRSDVDAKNRADEQAKVQTSLNNVSDQLQDAKKRAEDAARVIAALRGNRSPEAQRTVQEAIEKQKRAEKEETNAQNELIELRKKYGIPEGQPQGGAQPGSVAPGGEMTPEQIHAANVKSVILIEATWKITDTGTGAQIYLYHHPNDLGACPQAAKSEYLPMFVEDGGTLSPVLSTLPNEGNNTPIVGTESGSGFIVGGAGFFLTNRHVLAPWRATWNLSSFTKKSVGLKIKNGSIVGCIPASDFPSEWVPSEGSKMVVDKIESVMNPASGVSTTSTFSDRLKYNPLKTGVQGEGVFNVTFAKTTQRYRASSVTLSEKHDVALGKVDFPGSIVGVTMFTDASTISPGQPVVVMGYPAISPDVFGVEVSRDMFTNRAHLSAIADPTLSEGPISKVLLSGNSVRGVDGYVSGGEVYQLGINTTGAGNSGGPVFNSKGQVIAIFYAGRNYGGATVTYAVPVKFGQELIDNPSVMR